MGMNRQQAINYLFYSGFSDEQINTIEQAFKQEPTPKSFLGVDCISREATVKRLCNLAEYMNEHKENSGAPYIMAALFIQDNKVEFPSVTPQEPKTGHWIDSSNGWMCSECNKDNTFDTNYCPNCGAKMVERQKREVNNDIH